MSRYWGNGRIVIDNTIDNIEKEDSFQLGPSNIVIKEEEEIIIDEDISEGEDPYDEDPILSIDCTSIEQTCIGGIPNVIWRKIFSFFNWENVRSMIRLKRSCKSFYKIIRTDRHSDMVCKFFSFDDKNHSSKKVRFSSNDRTLTGEQSWANCISKTRLRIGTFSWFISLIDNSKNSSYGCWIGVIHPSCIKELKDGCAAAYNNKRSYTFLTTTGDLANNGKYSRPFVKRNKEEKVIKLGDKVGVKVEFVGKNRANISFCVKGDWKVAFENRQGPFIPIVSLEILSGVALLFPENDYF